MASNPPSLREVLGRAWRGREGEKRGDLGGALLQAFSALIKVM